MQIKISKKATVHCNLYKKLTLYLEPHPISTTTTKCDLLCIHHTFFRIATTVRAIKLKIIWSHKLSHGLFNPANQSIS